MSTSPNLGLNLQDTGSNNGTWGVILNANQSVIDSRLGARVSVNCAGNANITVSASQAQNFFHTLTGVLTGSIKYILPAQGGLYFIKNSTTGSFTVTVVNDVAGTGVIVTQGTSQLLTSNPDTTTVASVIPSSISLSSLSVSGQITSTQATGTAPLVIASTTPVANLSIGGNAATATLASTVTTNANLTGGVTSVGNAATVVTNANLTGPITSTGNAVTALTAHNVLLGNGSSAIVYAPPGTSGNVLTSNGASSNPTFQAISGIPVVTNTSSGKIVTGAVTDQWGLGSISSGTSAAVTFGTAFSDNPYSVVITSTVNRGTPFSVTSVSASGFTATGPSATTGFYWRAIGPT